MNSCNSCYHHCATLVSEGNKDHTKTMTSATIVRSLRDGGQTACAAQPVCRHDLRSLREDVRRIGAACVGSRDEHMAECTKACPRLCRGLPRDDQADGRNSPRPQVPQCRREPCFHPETGTNSKRVPRSAAFAWTCESFDVSKTRSRRAGMRFCRRSLLVAARFANCAAGFVGVEVAVMVGVEAAKDRAGPGIREARLRRRDCGPFSGTRPETPPPRRREFRLRSSPANSGRAHRA